MKVLQELVGGDKPLRYLCEDETRLGLQTIPGRLITVAGVKPIGMAQWMRDNFYLYGVVEPLTGDSFFYEFSHLDSSCYQHFLELVSHHWSDSVVVMQMDQGKFHSARDLDWPENIIGIFQPAHAPELNPPIAVMGTSQSTIKRGKLSEFDTIATEIVGHFKKLNSRIDCFAYRLGVYY